MQEADDRPVSEEARGGLLEYNDGRIVSDDHFLLLADGEFIEPLQRAKTSRDKHKGLFWRRVGPLEFHGVEIRQHTRLYHDEWEEHIQAVEVDLDEDGVPWVHFKFMDSQPTRYVDLSGEDLAEWIGDGTLKSNQQIHEETMEALSAAGSERGKK